MTPRAITKRRGQPRKRGRRWVSHYIVYPADYKYGLGNYAKFTSRGAAIRYATLYRLGSEIWKAVREFNRRTGETKWWNEPCFSVL